MVISISLKKHNSYFQPQRLTIRYTKQNAHLHLGLKTELELTNFQKPISRYPNRMFDQN